MRMAQTLLLSLRVHNILSKYPVHSDIARGPVRVFGYKCIPNIFPLNV